MSKGKPLDDRGLALEKLEARQRENEKHTQWNKYGAPSQSRASAAELTPSQRELLDQLTDWAVGEPIPVVPMTTDEQRRAKYSTLGTCCCPNSLVAPHKYESDRCDDTRGGGRFCVCGHVAGLHDQLDGCQADADDGPCHCDGFELPEGNQPDMVNHPPHYTNHLSGVECIDVTQWMNFCLGNAIKYIWRADLKGGVEDLKKAVWYIQREIARRDG